MTKPRYPVRACVAGSQVRGETASSSASSAFNVNLNNGNVNNNHRNNSGFGLACRRAREFQGAGRVELRALFDAYQAARRGKRPSFDKLGFERRWIDQLYSVQAELNAGTWAPSASTCFIATRPKAREIHAPAFRDRVVHHWLVPQLEAIYEPRFIAHSYANRVGKGSHAAVRYAQRCVHQVQDGQGGGFFLKLDIHNFFNSIRRDLLWAQMKPVLQRAGSPDAAMRATHALLRGDPLRAGVRLRATAEQLALVPRHKRLDMAPRHCGLPIGNLSSQFLANVCLDALDQFVKHTLKARRYVRYVDDFVLFHQDRAQLQRWLRQIETFLSEKLGLRLKDATELRPLTAGLDFLGYVIYPTHTLVRRRVVAHLQEALSNWEVAHVRGNKLRGTPGDFDHIRTVLASYAGHMRHAATWRLWRRIERRFPWIPTAARARRFSHRLRARHITLRSQPMRQPRPAREALNVRAQRQLDLYRDDPARLAAAHRIADDVALHDPHWTPAEQRRRHDQYINDAERLERAAMERKA
ncbi:RNA-directed DNA polymerase [Luteimonas sp. FCS-9]|uniref:RNA-directed DNA polymerase n=1 Tax=Luteimonas sp. FCS-9 TaxID=1547516 RepID=UPI0009E4B773|nr:RNA-directed DNA polymerase [Luteimonas sp. FCS-9]